MRLESYPQILTALSESAAGESLRQTFRWSQFRTTESNDKWHDALGETCQVFSHGKLFYRLAETFLAYEDGRFTPEEQETFLYGVAVHDIGEAKIDGTKYVGDVGAYKKTARDEKKEVKVAYAAIDSLDLPGELKTKLLDSYKMVVEGGDPKLNLAFKALEKTEYVITAMKAFQRGRIMREQGKRPLKYEAALVGRVLVFDLMKDLKVYVPEFPNSIGRMFKAATPLIDDMLAYSLPWLEANTEWNGKTVDHKALAEAFKSEWEAFKATK